MLAHAFERDNRALGQDKSHGDNNIKAQRIFRPTRVATALFFGIPEELPTRQDFKLSDIVGLTFSITTGDDAMLSIASDIRQTTADDGPSHPDDACDEDDQ